MYCIDAISLSLDQREKSIHLLVNKANIPGCYSPPHAQLNTLENLPAFSVSHDNMIKPESHDSGATNKHHHTRWTSFRQVSGVFYWRITAFWRQFLFYYRRRHLSLDHFDLVPSLNTQMYESECDRSAMRICKLNCPSFNAITLRTEHFALAPFIYDRNMKILMSCLFFYLTLWTHITKYPIPQDTYES